MHVNAEQAFIFRILEPILCHQPECRAVYAPDGRILAEGDRFSFEQLGEALERYGTEGPEPFYSGEVAERVSGWVLERGGTLGPDDLAAYRPELREPVQAAYRGRDVLTNPPPSSGGLLIAFALSLLDQAETADVAAVVAAMEEAQVARTEAFFHGLYEDRYARRFLSESRVETAAERVRGGRRPPDPPAEPPGDRLGSTTHITAVDAEGRCAAVTCSNGTGSGVIVPGTGIHVNNMLGEEDLNPLGFHVNPPGRRVPSMMSPTVVLRERRAGGGARQRRIEPDPLGVLQTIIRLIDDGMEAQPTPWTRRASTSRPAPSRPSPASTSAASTGSPHCGYQIVRWEDRNLFFGGVHAVARDLATGELQGGGDPRRGGAVAYA